MHSGRWNEYNCYVDYTIEAIVIKEYATYRELLDEVAKQVCVDLRFNSVKLKYKIEGSNAPLEIHNGVRVYVYLKKDSKELAKYPQCVSVFVNDCELTDRNILEDGVGMCEIDGRDIVDTQALVLSVMNNSDYMNCDIITNNKHKPSNLLDTYNIPITPLPDQNEWNVPEYIKDDIMRPPKHKKLPRRPSKKYRDKVYSELSGKKRKNFVVLMGLRGTIGIHVRIDCVLFS
ncbi:hypothetical protein H5410_047651 [Solanum commersonii]|uniref:Uncharacterized protein n=1 Tax=Solanum commersonii TaxID=4109 RepID=A0A9J5XFR2_SOLCO|nr:hypothetical protein H5410_047651 [Solanum commersonii]